MEIKVVNSDRYQKRTDIVVEELQNNLKEALNGALHRYNRTRDIKERSIYAKTYNKIVEALDEIENLKKGL